MSQSIANLLLHNHGLRLYLITMSDFSDPEFTQITISELAARGQGVNSSD